MSSLRETPRRIGASFIALAGVLAVSLTAPIPSWPDDRRARVIGEIQERLPGWVVERVDPSWEGAYTVVTVCAGREIGFQFVPGHGLPSDDAWLQPNDPYSRERLRRVSDHWRHLVWYDDPAMMSSLSCQDEIAHGGRQASIEQRDYD